MKTSCRLGILQLYQVAGFKFYRLISIFFSKFYHVFKRVQKKGGVKDDRRLDDVVVESRQLQIYKSIIIVYVNMKTLEPCTRIETRSIFWLTDWLANKMQVCFEIKVHCSSKYLIYFKVQHRFIP